MNNWTIPIYLYFISKNHGVDGKFQDFLFNFHRMVSINKLMHWDRIFIFENQKVVDNYYDRTITSLLFHGFIDTELFITNKGLNYLSNYLNEDSEFTRSLDFFTENYQGEFAIEKGCFVSIDHFPTACHICTNRVCEKNQSLLQCFNSFLKPLKNPYRSYSKTS